MAMTQSQVISLGHKWTNHFASLQPPIEFSECQRAGHMYAAWIAKHGDTDQTRKRCFAAFGLEAIN